MTTARIGVISDTHGLLRDEALGALEGSDLILHAGDIGNASVIDALTRIAPVHAIRGNVDRGEWARPFPETRVVEHAGLRIYMVHDVNALAGGAAPADVDAVVCGHSHKPAVVTRDGVLIFNPGSAGPRRFRLPVCVGVLHLANGGLTPEIVDLGLVPGT